MARTLQDYANAVRLGPVDGPGQFRRFADVNIQRVDIRRERLVATMLWNRYPHPLSFAVVPDDVLLWGGDLPIEEASLDEWADEAASEFASGAELPLMASRRKASGREIELTEAEPLDERYVGGHLRGTPAPGEWDEVARYADPRVPPPTVVQWRLDGTLISWHYVSLNHGRVLPVYGHGAARWVADGAASFDYLQLSPGLPATFGLMTVADAVHRAAVEGAHTIVSSVDVPGIELLGFRGVSGSWEVDNQFLDIDYEGIEAFVAGSSDWAPPAPIQADMTRADNATYYAG